MTVPIKCVVVGQSNSLLHYGFAEHLSKRPGMMVTRFGAVSSSALLAPLFIQPGRCAGQNFCIVDVATFDQSIVERRHGRDDVEALRRCLRHAIHVARADGCCPILMVFGTASFELNGRWYWLTEEVSEIIQLHRRVAAEEQCPLFDWWSFVDLKRREDPRLVLRNFYADALENPEVMDGSHPRSNYQAEIARYLHHYMEEHLTRSRAEVPVSVALSLFRRVVLADVARGGAKAARSNGATRFDLLSIAEGDVVEVPLDRDDLIAGYSVNVNECAGLVRFGGEPTVVKDLRFVDTIRGGSVRYHIAPIFADCGPIEGRLTIEAVGSAVPATEDGLLPTDDAALPGPAVIEIESLLVERPARLDYRTSHRVETDGDIVAVCFGDPRLQKPAPPAGESPVSITAYIAMLGDRRGTGCAVSGDKKGQNIQGFLLEAPDLPADQLRYRVRDDAGLWSAWSHLGAFAGTRDTDRDLTGFCVALEGAGRECYDLQVTGAFRGVPDQLVVGSGEACAPLIGSASLWKILLNFRPKPVPQAPPAEAAPAARPAVPTTPEAPAMDEAEPEAVEASASEPAPDEPTEHRALPEEAVRPVAVEEATPESPPVPEEPTAHFSLPDEGARPVAVEKAAPVPPAVPEEPPEHFSLPDEAARPVAVEEATPVPSPVPEEPTEHFAFSDETVRLVADEAIAPVPPVVPEEPAEHFAFSEEAVPPAAGEAVAPVPPVVPEEPAEHFAWPDEAVPPAADEAVAPVPPVLPEEPTEHLALPHEAVGLAADEFVVPVPPVLPEEPTDHLALPHEAVGLAADEFVVPVPPVVPEEPAEHLALPDEAVIPVAVHEASPAAPEKPADHPAVADEALKPLAVPDEVFAAAAMLDEASEGLPVPVEASAPPAATGGAPEPEGPTPAAGKTLIAIRAQAVDDHLMRMLADLRSRTTCDVVVVMQDDTATDALRAADPSHAEVVRFSQKDIHDLGIATFDAGRWDIFFGDVPVYYLFEHRKDYDYIVMLEHDVKINFDIDAFVARIDGHLDFVALYAGFSNADWMWHATAAQWFADPRGSSFPIVCVSRRLAAAALKCRVALSDRWIAEGVKTDDQARYIIHCEAIFPSVAAERNFPMADLAHLVPGWDPARFTGYGLFLWDDAALDGIAAIHPCLPADAMPAYYKDLMASPYLPDALKDSFVAEREALIARGFVL